MSTRSGAEDVSEAFQERFQQFFRNVSETFLEKHCRNGSETYIKKPKQPKSFFRNGSETFEKRFSSNGLQGQKLPC